MKWWGFMSLGLLWCVCVALVTVLSLRGANQAVADGLASDFGTGGIAISAISALIFALPGIVFLIVGVRKQRRGY